MRTIHLYGSKGGVQTSTVAACLALSHDASVVLIDVDGDQAAILGLPALDDRIANTKLEEAREFAPNGRLLRTSRSFVGPLMTECSLTGVDLVVVDHGVAQREQAMVLGGSHIVCVQACYLSVRRALNTGQWDEWIHTGSEAQRALRDRDLEHAMGCAPVARIPHDPAMARAIDAGMLSSRPVVRRLAMPMLRYLEAG